MDPLGRLVNYTVTYIDGILTAHPLPSTVVMNSQLPADADMFGNGFSFTRFAFAGRWGGLHGAPTNTSFDIEIDPALQQEFGFINPWKE